MAGTLARVTDFVPSTPILSSEVDAEFNQIVLLLNATSTNVKAALKLSDAGDAPLELNQLSTGPILKGFQAGVENFRIRNDGSLRTPGIYDTNDNEQLLFSLTASAINEFTMKNAATGNPPELRVTGGNTDISLKLVPKGTGVVKIQAGLPVANEDAANKLYVDSKLVPFVMAWRIDDPANFAINDTSLLTVIRVPAIVGGFLKKITIIRYGGSHTAGGSVTFAADLNTATVGSGVAFNDTNNAAFTFYTDDFTDVAISEGDAITVKITAKSGTISETKVSVNLEGYRKVS